MYYLKKNFFFGTKNKPTHTFLIKKTLITAFAENLLIFHHSTHTNSAQFFAIYFLLPTAKSRSKTENSP